MEEHKRQMRKQREPKRGLGFGGGVGVVREEAAAKRAKRAAEAKAESERILREEQGKDADWREAMLRQVQEVRGGYRCWHPGKHEFGLASTAVTGQTCVKYPGIDLMF
jgi:hypothetical protein